MEHRRVCFCMLKPSSPCANNKLSQANSLLFGKSLLSPLRGAWIENNSLRGPAAQSLLVARSAWIEEISAPIWIGGEKPVAPLAGCVD